MNNRRVPRSFTDSSVQICVGDEVFIQGQFQDFSHIGAKVQLPCYVKPKTFVKIGYRDKAQQVHLIHCAVHLIHCAVIWIQNKSKHQYELGLQFIAY
jgi:hypothetical protein